jgi:hypothetical protein
LTFLTGMEVIFEEQDGRTRMTIVHTGFPTAGLDAARQAFTQGLRLTFAISAVVVVGIAILVVALLRGAGAGAEPEEQPAPSQEGSCCAGKVGVVKVAKASKS